MSKCPASEMLKKVLMVCMCVPLMVSAYEEAPVKEDLFASNVCPAFLFFDSVAFLSDTTITLACQCKPEEVKTVVWYYQKQTSSSKALVLTDFKGTTAVEWSKVPKESDLRSRFAIRLFSLLIFRSQRVDSGNYICGTVSGEFFYGYNVDVQDVRRVSVPSSLHQRTRLAAKSEQFQVFTKHFPWSSCDRCGRRGEKTRVGLCYVKSPYVQVRYRHNKGPEAPCGSSGVPSQFELSEYGGEFEVTFCTVPCPPKPTLSPERKDWLKFLNRDDRVKGGVPVQFHNQAEGTEVVLTCPGARPLNIVAWDKGLVPLYRSQYLVGLGDLRVFIDTGHRLVFQPVLMEDRGSYFCWVQGKLSAEIRLRPYAPLASSRHITDNESLLALRHMLYYFSAIAAFFLLTVSVRFMWHIRNA